MPTPGMPMPGMLGAAQPTTAFGKGMNLLMKRMTEPPSVKPPPKGCVSYKLKEQTHVCFSFRAEISCCSTKATS